MKKEAGKIINPKLLGRLIELKLKLDSMKPIYQEYDRVLELALKSGKIPDQVKIGSDTYVIAVTDLFEQKNTAWKSVAQRRFDVTVSKKRKAL